MLNKTMSEKYALFIDTLNLLLIPSKEVGIPYLTSVQAQLEELEGDFYTFLQKEFVIELLRKGYLSSSACEAVENIRLKISEIDRSLWDAGNFIENSVWQEIRYLVLDLFRNDLNTENGF